MFQSRHVKSAVLLLVVCLAAACGDLPPSTTPDAGVQASLIPLQVGNEWTYRVTSSSGVVTEKKNTVTGTVAVGTETAFRLTTSRANERETTSVQIIRDGVLLRLSEDSYRAGILFAHDVYLPGAIRIDANKAKSGDTYEGRHTKQVFDGSGNMISSVEVVNRFVVEAIGEPVDVPAGRFACVRVKRTATDDSTKTYWFVPGLGKVKEVGGQTEELERHTVTP